MLFTYKRKILALVLALLLALVFITACTGTFAKGDQEKLTVNFIDVGFGDATLISLPDGKTMLIDTGANTSSNKDKVSETVEKYTKRIDYLVLTNLNNEHISNAINIVETFEIDKAFLPYVADKTPFITFKNIYDALLEREVAIQYSKSFTDLSTLDYTLVFLSPNASGVDGDYNKFNYSEIKTQSLINNLSPIIYLEFCGVKFVFSSDSEISQENWVVESYKGGLYDTFGQNGHALSLEDIDFYKLSNHGGDVGNSSEFLSLLKPKNAIISVGGANNLGYPSTSVLTSLTSVNPDHKLYRTDMDKTVRVEVNNFGKYQIYKGE
ncbi:MAG: hypothetical protein IJW43_03225 [Clostridia bacterium]|nr:hypothetical protein [Clostridia bacterium]